jgi:hypothetical protein
MNRKWIVGLGLIASLGIPVAARAHGGHTHKALGTVSSIQGDHVEVKTTDGKVVTVMLDKKTAITRGKTKLGATALRVGERISIDYMQEKNKNMAKTVKLAEAQASQAR